MRSLQSSLCTALKVIILLIFTHVVECFFGVDSLAKQSKKKRSLNQEAKQARFYMVTQVIYKRKLHEAVISSSGFRFSWSFLRRAVLLSVPKKGRRLFLSQLQCTNKLLDTPGFPLRRKQKSNIFRENSAVHASATFRQIPLKA